MTHTTVYLRSGMPSPMPASSGAGMIPRSAYVGAGVDDGGAASQSPSATSKWCSELSY